MLELQCWVMFCFDPKNKNEIKLIKCFKSKTEAEAWWVNSSLCERGFDVRYTIAEIREIT